MHPRKKKNMFTQSSIKKYPVYTDTLENDWKRCTTYAPAVALQDFSLKTEEEEHMKHAVFKESGAC